MQHLLSRARWDAGRAQDDVRGHVVEHLGDPQAVLVVDETGDLRNTGMARWIENAQVAACLGYSSPGGHELMDPRCPWTGTAPRRPGTRWWCQARLRSAGRRRRRNVAVVLGAATRYGKLARQKVPRHDDDNSTPRVTPSLLLCQSITRPSLPHCDQHAPQCQAQEPDSNAYKYWKVKGQWHRRSPPSRSYLTRITE